MRLVLILFVLLVFSCSGKRKATGAAVAKEDSLNQADSIKVLADNSMIRVFADYNMNSTFHEDQKKGFDYWNYDSAYYRQRISAQNQNRKREKLFVPNVLKGIWIPVYSFASTFYVQKDCDAQERFSINDSTFNYFDGMMVVEPFVMDKIKMELGDFEITTRTSKKIELTKVDDERLIFKVAMANDRCIYVTRLSDINRFPILVVECKGSAVPIEQGIELDMVVCEMNESAKSDSLKKIEFWNAVVMPILNHDKSIVLSNMDFPVYGHWTRMMEINKKPDEATREDFVRIYDHFFNHDFMDELRRSDQTTLTLGTENQREIQYLPSQSEKDLVLERGDWL